MFDRIVLFIQTHADKDRGDLFYRCDKVGSDSRSTSIDNVGDRFSLVLSILTD
jgi:hypothetical protein